MRSENVSEVLWVCSAGAERESKSGLVANTSRSSEDRRVAVFHFVLCVSREGVMAKFKARSEATATCSEMPTTCQLNRSKVVRRFGLSAIMFDIFNEIRGRSGQRNGRTDIITNDDA
jgi:hypothetical protein